MRRHYSDLRMSTNRTPVGASAVGRAYNPVETVRAGRYGGNPMRPAFQETLCSIKSQSQVLGDREEKAVEIAVIVPLLQQLGWRTHIVTEVYPQRKLPNNQRPDFELQVDSKSRAVVEVKKWAADLNADNEKQLQAYCREVDPDLAALTNGHRWWLYVGPWKRPKGGALRPFLDFDIGGDPEEVEGNFWEFLSRENLTAQQDVNRTVAAAKALRRSQQRRAEIMRRLRDVWNDLETNERGLFEVVKTLAEDHGIHPSDEDVEEFLEKSAPLVNRVPNKTNPGPDHSKPVFFTVRKTGEKPFREGVKNWTGVRLGVCRLMLERDEEGLRQLAAKRPDWFPDAPGQYRQEIDQAGIFVPTGGARQGIIRVCHEILAEFGYPKESLEIQMKGN